MDSHSSNSDAAIKRALRQMTDNELGLFYISAPITEKARLRRLIREVQPNHVLSGLFRGDTVRKMRADHSNYRDCLIWADPEHLRYFERIFPDLVQKKE